MMGERLLFPTQQISQTMQDNLPWVLEDVPANYLEEEF